MRDFPRNQTLETGWMPGRSCSNGSEESWLGCSLVSRSLVVTFMLLLACAVVAGNSIAVAVFLRTRESRTPQGYLKVSLALADLAVGLLVLPFSAYTEIALLGSASRPPGHSAAGGGALWQPCSLVGVVFAGCTFVSISTIFLLSLERGVAILRPLHKEVVVTRRRTWLLILLSWLAGFLLAAAPLLSGGHFSLEYSECSRMCNYAWAAGAPPQAGGSILLLFPAFDFTILGGTVMVNALSFRTIRRYSERRKVLAELGNLPASLRPSSSDIKAAKTIGILTLIFTASFSPVAAFVLGSVMGYRWCSFSFFAFWVLASNSCCNVLIYSVRDQRFRKGLHQLFHKTPH
ncbi:adenosine receptor A3 [Hemiscyllium ocellatum]|uniref:adenosine receptor A3 n=1 Tax=Hemiscyllium ocellatum TaxID=170820 RepID=UPI002965F674|nr:adenosine receptor A3 [Hemiscyllium ocellatum]